MSGFPPRGLMFLPGRPLEPPRAVITANTSGLVTGSPSTLGSVDAEPTLGGRHDLDIRESAGHILKITDYLRHLLEVHAWKLPQAVRPRRAEERSDISQKIFGRR